MVFDDTEPILDLSAFKGCDWSEFYPDAVEVLPPMMPQERGHLLMQNMRGAKQPVDHTRACFSSSIKRR